eukprot:381333-Pyramimonas_sp.AAC.1
MATGAETLVSLHKRQVYNAVEKLNSGDDGALVTHSLDQIRTADEILQAFAKYVWAPSRIQVDGSVRQEGLPRPILGRLSLLPTLLHVEITNCSWLQDLEWTAGLPNLRCLTVENSVALPSVATKALLWGSRKLQVLSLDGCEAIDDAIGTYIAG